MMSDLDMLRKRAKAAYKERAFGNAASLYAELLSCEDQADPMVEATDRVGYATALANLSRLEEAAVEIGKALRVMPEDPKLRHKMGDILGRLGRHREAVEEYREAARLSPGEADHEWRVAVELRALGDDKGAQEAIDRCLLIDPEHTEARLMQIEQVVLVAPERDGQVEEEWDGPRQVVNNPFAMIRVPDVEKITRIPMRKRPWFWALEALILLVGALWLRSQI